MEGKRGRRCGRKRETKGRTGRVGVSEGEGSWGLKAALLQTEGRRKITAAPRFDSCTIKNQNKRQPAEPHMHSRGQRSNGITGCRTGQTSEHAGRLERERKRDAETEMFACYQLKTTSLKNILYVIKM